MQTVIDIRRQFAELLYAGHTVPDKTGASVIEIMAVHFLADQSAIFGTPNREYIQREIAWYESMSLDVNDIPGGAPSVWQAVADDQGQINSNYGRLIWHEDHHDQYDHVRDELRANPHSRRAIMIYTRPSMWKEYDLHGRSDFICTNTVQYFVRDGALHGHVNMRSNDAIYGYKNDWAWQQHVLHMLADDLDQKPGRLYWTVGSLHIYERHFHLIGEPR